jgi:hypothetical protein
MQQRHHDFVTWKSTVEQLESGAAAVLQLPLGREPSETSERPGRFCRPRFRPATEFNNRCGKSDGLQRL